MSWTYKQNSGELNAPDGQFVVSGYAGGAKGAHPEGRNNPAMQDQHDIGPLPCGFYTMGEPREHSILGPYAIPLIPDASNEMFGRSAFYMHGDRIDAPGTASDGCIIMPRNVREFCWTSSDHRLEVVSGVANPS